MVNAPTFFFGQNQSGKTYRAFRLWERHKGPAVFCNIQWVNYVPSDIRARTAEDVISILSNAKSFANGPKIDWRLRNYNEFGTFLDYALDVHRARHEAGGALPTLAVFVDEVWRIAGRGADANNPAVRLFTEGNQHRVEGVALSQWVSQVSHLIPGNAYEFYIYHLWERDYEILRQIYRMEVPETAWLRDYHYWHYDGKWYRGYPDGREVAYVEQPTDSPDVHTQIQSGTEDRSVPDEPDSDAVPVPEKDTGGLDLYEVRKDKTDLDSYK